MRRLVVVMAVVLAVPLLFGATTSRADDGTFLNHIIPVPGFTNFADTAHPAGDGGSFDISWVDNDLYYLADRGYATGFASGRIDVIDALADTFLYSIPGFVGSNGFPSGPTATNVGPNGILVLHTGKGWNQKSELWAGDGNSLVQVVDLDKRKIVKTISTARPGFTGAQEQRADELAYDPKHAMILVANDASTPPFVTFISQKSRTVVGRIVYDGFGGRPDALDGIEQSVWDPVSGLFYLAVPQTSLHSGGEIDVLDSVTKSIVKRIGLPVGCNPHGLALGPNQQLCVGCNNSTPAPAQFTVIINTAGTVLNTIFEMGGSDEVWYNPGDYRYYLAASSCKTSKCQADSAVNVSGAPGVYPVLGVIDAGTLQFVQNLPGGNGAHSVAVNSTNNHIFFPLTIPNAFGSPTVPQLLQVPGLGLGIAVFEHEVEFGHEGEHEWEHEK